ncbi:hypothetical protein Tco_0625052 [Tanacetum coccineum]|uniref:Uncharacterized protein n=1 Tax=Tanacetum coccineum TaxID=301880 RepID=A0ABQ4WFN8_9ASTR
MPRISRQRFASQVDKKNDLYLPNVRESAPVKPHHVNAPSSSRNSHKESYGSNDMAHTYFLEKGRKKTQDKTRIPNHKDMASTRAHCTPNAWSPKPRNIYRSFPVSKCSGGMSNVQSPMIRNNNPVEPKNHTHKPGRQIGIGQRFSLNKSSAMHEKPQTPRSCLRAFTASANVPSIYIQLFWNTLTHDAKTEALEITLPWTNIVLKPDLALELGKSISLTETEEEAVAREVHATHPQGKQEMSKRQPELEAQLKELDDNVGDDNEETGAWDDNDDLAEICGSRLVHFITLLIDQDEQSTSTSPTNQEIQSLQVSLSGPVPQFMAPDHSSSGPVLHEMDGLIKSVQTSRPIDKRRCFSKAFSDVEHAECIDTRKSTSGGIQFLGDKLVSKMSKKQYSTAIFFNRGHNTSLFGQDDDTFISTMLLNVDQLQKQLDKDDFQEDGSMAAFWVINRQFQKFIDSQFSLDYDSQMTDKYFVEYTRIEAKNFKDTLLQHMGNVKKSIAERTRHQRQYDKKVNKRQMQTQESKIDTDIRPIYDEEPMAEVQLTAECNIFEIGQHHTEQPEISNEGRVDQYPEQCHVKIPMLDSSLDNQATEYSKQSLGSENILLKKTVAQFQKDFSRTEAHCIALELKYQNQALKSGQHGQILNETSNKAKIKKEIDVLETMNIELEHSVAKLRKENETLKKHYKDFSDLKEGFAIAALKNDLRKLKGNSIDTKFCKTSVLGKPVLQLLRNQSVVRQPNAFNSERPQMSKQRFASQVDMNSNLARPVTQHYLPKRRESVFAKPNHMIASSESRNSSKNMPRFSSNDIVHNHYLDEARKKTQERDRNSKTSVMTSARFQSTADGSKPKPRSTNHSTRSLPVSKSSCVTIAVVSIADHSKNSNSFSD